jgi:hypothetical protein
MKEWKKIISKFFNHEIHEEKRNAGRQINVGLSKGNLNEDETGHRA